MSIEIPFEARLAIVDIIARSPSLVLDVDGRREVVAFTSHADGRFDVRVGEDSYQGFSFVTPTAVWVRLSGRTHVFEKRRTAAGQNSSVKPLEVRAEMPGTVVAVQVAEGDDVKEGDPLITLESMKLQVTLNADRSGRVAKVYLRAGQSFERGAPVIEYSADAAGLAGKKGEAP